MIEMEIHNDEQTQLMADGMGIFDDVPGNAVSVIGQERYCMSAVSPMLPFCFL
jgi:hypothetical protein